MNNVDYVRALMDYKRAQQFGNQSRRQYRSAGPGTALAQALSGLVAGNNMSQAQHRMGVADQAEQDSFKLAMTNAMQAGQGATPYQLPPSQVSGFEGDTFTGAGLKNAGTGQFDPMKMAESMMGSGRKDLAAPAMNILARQPKAKPDYNLNNNRYSGTTNELLVEGPASPEDIEKAGKTRFDQTHKLRESFIVATKPFAKVNDAFGRIKASAEDPSPAGDMALIFNYMKMLDPGSVVRESEFQLAGSSGSLPQQIQVAWNKLDTGEKLSVEMRKDFVDRAKRLFEKSDSFYEKRRDEYSRIAESFGLDPTQVIINQSVADTVMPNMGGEPLRDPTAEQYKSLPIGSPYYFEGELFYKGK